MCDHYFLEFAGQKSSLYFDNRKLSILFIEQNESYQIFINIIFISIIFMPKKNNDYVQCKCPYPPLTSSF